MHFTMNRVRRALDEFVRDRGPTLPLPGSGNTWRRFEVLASAAANDLSAARLIEGHGDALAILAEAGVPPMGRGVAYGVWAARSSNAGTWAEPVAGGWQLSGSKGFCSGSTMLERALVTADTPDGYRIFDIDVAEHVTQIHADSWPAVGMADSMSETLDFAGPVIATSQAIGPAGFYTSRPGFWYGAAGVAACWYGGARGLVDTLISSLTVDTNEHVLADLGLAVGRVEAMRRVLQGVAEDIDADPENDMNRARINALVARQTVHDMALEVLVGVGAAGGARTLCLNGVQSRRAADLFAYLTQHHGRSDAAELGRLAREERT